MKNVKKIGVAARNCAAAGLIAAVAIASVPATQLLTPEYVSAETPAVAAESASVSARAAAAVDDFTLTVNYYRKDQNYTGYNMWIWSAGGNREGMTSADYCDDTTESKGIFTDEVEFEGKVWKTLSFTVTGAVPDDSGNVLGVIVRQSTSSNSWAAQTGDIKVSSDLIVDGEMTLYLAELNDRIYDSAEDAMANKIETAFFNAANRLNITTTSNITASSNFKVKNSADQVVGTLDCSTDSAAVGKKNASITLDANFDITDTYTVVDEPESFDIDVNFVGREVIKNAFFGLDAFGNMYNYDGELGVSENNGQYKFTVWSPVASNMTLNIYNSGELTDTAKTTHTMTKGTNGEWTVTVPDVGGKYYTYSATVYGETNEVVDPYARSAGRNGKRGMILDLDTTDPDGWNDSTVHKRPSYDSTAEAMSRSVIYEAQLRDLTIHESSNVSAANRGKFKGMTETGTDDNKTPLDYLKELGVTAVHFQPLFDFGSVDEKFNVATPNGEGEYNWGYDPVNYNVPEGSYSSNPADGATRVREMKEMIMALHNAGIQVVMDVVYNHVQDMNGSNFNKLMPGYYFRTDNTGKVYAGSGCGNDTASERAMFRRFMIDSVKYWQEEYKIDGFRFDLMGLHDIETMNAIYDELVKTNPDVMVYGEGWKMTTGLDASDAATQENASKMPNIAFFNDTIRDGLKGSVFEIRAKGFVSGNKNDGVVYGGAQGATRNFTSQPTQNVNYASAHDNPTLWDKLNASVNKDKDTLMAMNRLSATSVLTSQGVSFFLAGEEMMRSKPTTETNTFDNSPATSLTEPKYTFATNSYKSPDSVNAIDWSTLTNDDTKAMVDYYKALIGIKKTFPMFQLTTKAAIDSNLSIADTKKNDGIARYAIKDPASNSYAVVLFNATEEQADVLVPNGNYKIYVNGAQATADKNNPLDTFGGERFTVGAYSAVVMVADLDGDTVKAWVDKEAAEANPPDPAPTGDGDSDLGLKLGLGIGIPVAVLAAGGAAAAVVLTKKKKGKKGSEEPAGEEDKVEDKPEDESAVENTADNRPDEANAEEKEENKEE